MSETLKLQRNASIYTKRRQDKRATGAHFEWTRKKLQSGLEESEARGGRDGANEGGGPEGGVGWVRKREEGGGETRVGRVICTTTKRTNKIEETKLGDLLD